ncbi:DUF3383 family protein [uncultured Dysosmobacter sp.]|uniref:DUF3383 family protein n=1 Tax=uncultured Dysosmobacter sp. TaxID=2591384 RepID=UPI0026169A26|nr:DUF3383 family protein [uncultured Dysosmobacter sp.]
MQDIIVYIALDTAAAERETLVPLILSFEGAAPYKEYNKIEDVQQDFSSAKSPTALAAAALFDQIKVENCPGRTKKVAVLGLEAESEAQAVTTALDTLRETHDDWYFLYPTKADAAMIAALAKWADATVLTQAQLEAGQVESEKLLFVQTTDKEAITEDVKKCRQTVVCYNHDAENSCLPAAWIGRVAPHYPTAVTWKWKELYGIPVTDEDGVDLQDMLEGRYNLYIKNHGREYTSEGICVDGDFIDTVIGRWQIKRTMRTKLVNLFVDTEHIGYDDEGFTQVAQEVIAALDEATANGIILQQDKKGVYTVNIPTRADATEEQARNRIMPPITWEATVRGGVHGVRVNGVLTVALTGASS